MYSSVRISWLYWASVILVRAVPFQVTDWTVSPKPLGHMDIPTKSKVFRPEEDTVWETDCDDGVPVAVLLLPEVLKAETGSTVIEEVPPCSTPSSLRHR